MNNWKINKYCKIVANFWREKRRARAYFPPAFGLNINTEPFKNFSMCKISFSVLLPVFMGFRGGTEKISSVNPILNCSVQRTKYTCLPFI